MTNSVDPDQLAFSEANWSGSTLFAKAGYIRFSRTRINVSKKHHHDQEDEFFTLIFQKKYDKDLRSPNS